MIARARAVSHGNAYTTYATHKHNAEFVCSENFAGDMTVVASVADFNDIWMQLKHSAENYMAKGKPVTRSIIVMEVSPTKDETRGWTLEQWADLAHHFISEMDKIQFTDKNGKVSAKRTDFANSKWLAMLHRDAKSGIPHMHFMISRFTIDGRINDTNLIGLKAMTVANSINESMGWKQPKEIGSEHRVEIKNEIYDILRCMGKFSWNSFILNLNNRGYKAEVRTDAQNRVISYTIQRGNSRYNASQIGRHLTASRIEETWRHVHKNMDEEKDKAKINKDKTDGLRHHYFICEPLNPYSRIIRFELEHSFYDNKEAERCVFDVSEKVIDTITSTFSELEDECEFVLDDVVKIGILMFFDLLTIPNTNDYSLGGGGGGSDESPKKKNDDEEELLRARQIARAIANNLPRKAKRGYRR